MGLGFDIISCWIGGEFKFVFWSEFEFDWFRFWSWFKTQQTHINYYYNNGNMGCSFSWLLRSSNCELGLIYYECVFLITKIMVGSHATSNLMFNDVLVEVFQHGKNFQSCKVTSIGLVETKGPTKLFSHSTWTTYVSLTTTTLHCTHVMKQVMQFIPCMQCGKVCMLYTKKNIQFTIIMKNSKGKITWN
jgi:hypothetical protein